MIVRPAGILSRLMPRRNYGKSRECHAWPSTVLSAQAFSAELARETARSNRRRFAPEFALVVCRFPEGDSPTPVRYEWCCAVVSGLRFSDSVGIYRDGLGILCPETDRRGGEVVAREALELATQNGLKLQVDVLEYPWDDLLATDSADFQELAPERREGTRGGSSEHSSGADTGKENATPPAADWGPLRSPHLQDSGDSGAFPRQRGLSPFAANLPTPWWKRATDLGLAGCLLIALAPLFLLLALAVKFTSRGPVFYRQLREGKDGRRFAVVKFRTMVVDAESMQKDLWQFNEQDGPAFRLTHDPRVTRVGRFLRRTCLDELPQLLNVLRGEMSLVGPRPLKLDESFSCYLWQRHRLRVLPGLTCYWQVDRDADTRFSDWMRMDLRYLQTRSFWTDLKLIGRTILVVLMQRGSP